MIKNDLKQETAAFGKGVQRISGSPYDETDQPRQVVYSLPRDAKLRKYDLGSRGEDIAYP